MIRFFTVIFFGATFFYVPFLSAQQASVVLTVPNQYGEQGRQIDVPVSVGGFTDIIAFQFSLNWDAAQLKYLGVSNFGIKDLGQEDFNIPSADVGHLRLAWDPTDVTAVTVPDGTVLFTATFEIIVSENSDIPITFTDVSSATPYPIEFANDMYEILPTVTNSGTITAVADFAELVNISSSPNTSCNKLSPNGSLKADVEEDSLNYTFRWYIGNELKAEPDYIGYRYNNLESGDYTLQVLDPAGEVFAKSVPASVADQSNYQPDEIAVIVNNPQTSCSDLPEKRTGMLEITVNGAQNPDQFTISWWFGSYQEGEELAAFSNQFEAVDLEAGGYEIVAESKGTGCVTYQTAPVLYEPVDVSLILTSTPDNFCKGGANGSAGVRIVNSEITNVGYFWFEELADLDTSNAKYKGSEIDQLSAGIYKTLVFDYDSECSGTGNVSVTSDEIYAEALIKQEGTALITNSESSLWFISENGNNIFLQYKGLVYSPEESGFYFTRIINEYNCQSDSEELYYGVTGLEENEHNLTVFPNPFSDFVRVANRDGELELVQVFDAKGSLIIEKNAIKKKFIDLSLTGSPSGIYFLHIRNKGKTDIRKLIKNRSN